MSTTGEADKSKFAKVLRIVKWTVLGIALAVIFALIFGLVVQWLWGVTLTPLFGFAIPSYWQAVGLVVLARLIFGGFHPGGNNKFDRKYKHPHSKRELAFQKLHDRLHGSYADEPLSHSFPIPEEQRQHYRDFWEKEGKDAFAAYLNRQEPDNA